MEKGILHLRELAMWEMIHYDLDNAYLHKDPDKVQWLQPIKWKCVQSTPTLHANPLTTLIWKDNTPLTVDEVSHFLWEYEDSISSSLISAVKKLSDKLIQEFQQLRGISQNG